MVGSDKYVNVKLASSGVFRGSMVRWPPFVLKGFFSRQILRDINVETTSEKSYPYNSYASYGRSLA
jgi:hypothetical protein